MVLDETLVVSRIDFKEAVYFGQKENNMINGVGRKQSNQLQEGMWINNKLNGYGRIIFEN